jgi:hypothetical protein
LFIFLSFCISHSSDAKPKRKEKTKQEKEKTKREREGERERELRSMIKRKEGEKIKFFLAYLSFLFFIISFSLSSFLFLSF